MRLPHDRLCNQLLLFLSLSLDHPDFSIYLSISLSLSLSLSLSTPFSLCRALFSLLSISLLPPLRAHHFRPCTPLPHRPAPERAYTRGTLPPPLLSDTSAASREQCCQRATRCTWPTAWPPLIPPPDWRERAGEGEGEEGGGRGREEGRKQREREREREKVREKVRN